MGLQGVGRPGAKAKDPGATGSELELIPLRKMKAFVTIETLDLSSSKVL